MGEVAVVFDGVWKKFRRGERHDSLRDLLPSLARRLARRARASELDEREFWALRDISFEVRRGEALGIIGPNGAGKSTTLKLLSRILKPTRGRCDVRGRLSALIEVAAGFHPDLTGRENIYLQGAIMGMKRCEIARRFAEIVEFAGVQEFVDTPVKRYSSGMNARLGFSIAAHLDPDVLLIDEVLAVGDMEFQQRCVRRMQEFKHRGVAIVFVSHNLQAVASLCERAQYLDGQVRACGEAQAVIEAYVSSRRQASDMESSGVRILSTELVVSAGCTPGVVLPHRRQRLLVKYGTTTELRDVEFGFLVYRSSDALMVYGRGIPCEALGLRTIPARSEVGVEFSFDAHLTRGQYHVECHVFHRPSYRYLARTGPAAMFRIEEAATYAGIANLGLSANVLNCASASFVSGAARDRDIRYTVALAQH